MDLNCDLGEGEPPETTRELMRWITSANIACGGHAGDATTIRNTLALAREFNVRVGAHPGLPDRESKGRNERSVRPEELESLLVGQIGTLLKLAAECGLPLHHIKLHGALYHLTERDPVLRAQFLDTVHEYWPGAIVYALAHGQVCALARARNMTAWNEAFADRAYLPDGTLKPRSHERALLPLDQALIQGRRLLAGEPLFVGNATTLPIKAETVCVHSDASDAASLMRMLATR